MLLFKRGLKTLPQSLKRYIDISPEVQRSMQRGDAIVALESTIITHGMPYPHNLNTAQEVEELVRVNQATPATIAIVDGRIKVGLTAHDLTSLAKKQRDEVIKCSRRDLPYVMSQRRCGGTTVAGTMIVANAVGLPVFATGGVGGVHREGHTSMDVSADLVELGRTPMAVVCSGVKSILDIPRTLEYLETQGVCVATFQSPGGRFPDFYTRDSGCRVPYNLDSPAEAASLIHSLLELELKSGILIGVPIPAEFEAKKQLIDAAISEAYDEADRQGVTGKEVTPFLLSAIANITKGDSLKANMALIKNNASVAAQIAKELSKGTRSTTYITTTTSASPLPQSSASNVPLVIGGSILDLSLSMLDDMPKVLNGATYMTTSKQSAGGVGRNLAEGIFKINGAANFLSVVGDDQLGKSLLELIPPEIRSGVEIDDQKATSLCGVIFDKYGDCKLILGNMEIHESISAERVKRRYEQFKAAPMIVMDSNLPLSSTEMVLQLAQKYQRPVFFEPTDMRIAGKPFTLPPELTRQIKIVSPNIYELKTIAETITEEPINWEVDVNEASTPELVAKAKELVVQVGDRFDCILATLGRHGVLVHLRSTPENRLFNAETGAYLAPPQAAKFTTTFYAAPVIKGLKNVSGAGDSFSAGFIGGLLRGYEVRRAVALGFLAAEKSLRSTSAVPKVYFADANEQGEAIRRAEAELRSENLS